MVSALKLQILRQTDLKTRVKTVKYLITVLHHLFKIGDVCGCKMFLYAFQSGPVFRLQQTLTHKVTESVNNY